jgi:hypothetical protein
MSSKSYHAKSNRVMSLLACVVVFESRTLDSSHDFLNTAISTVSQYPTPYRIGLLGQFRVKCKATMVVALAPEMLMRFPAHILPDISNQTWDLNQQLLTSKLPATPGKVVHTTHIQIGDIVKSTFKLLLYNAFHKVMWVFIIHL